MSDFTDRGAGTERGGAASQGRSSPRAYPDELAFDVTTSEGLHLHMRPIHPGDAALLVNFHSRLSIDSVYRRYFSMHPELSDVEVVHLTTVDYLDRLAFIVQDGDALVAVGRYDRIPGTTSAEVAFVVADKYQRKGIGLWLLEHLAEEAWSLGITTFVAETQADNMDMMSVFESAGYPVKSRIEDEIINVRFPIEPTPRSEELRAQRLEHERPSNQREHS
ncbi:MAG TPA: GNAT family N-acetyltransferase [Acidimicrobiales bacterium]|nr:GNAT family N-acetyltransferase [Acidimicrobiales bacterium]